MQNELYHWGIKGQRWGFRRYQNPDGTLTAAGKERYGASYNTMKEVRAAQRSENRVNKAIKTGKTRGLTDDELARARDRLDRELKYSQMFNQLNPKKESRAKKVLADIAEASAKSLAKTAIEKLGKNLFEGSSEISEYSYEELDKLTDAQIKAYADRQKNKKDALGNVKNQIGTMTSIKEDEEAKAKKQEAEAKKKQEAEAKKKEEAKAKKQEAAAKRKEAAQARRQEADARKQKSKERKAKEAYEAEDMRDRTKSVRFDSWMETDYADAFNFSSKSSAKKQTEKYADLRVDQIFNSEDDYYDWRFGSGRNSAGIARWSDIGEDFLAHHGIKGQKWGVRRYQNLDGTWTEAGKKRYGSSYFFELERDRGGYVENQKRIGKMSSKVNKDNAKWAKAQFRTFSKNMNAHAKKANAGRVRDYTIPDLDAGTDVLDRIRALESRGEQIKKGTEQYPTDFYATTLSKARKDYEEAFRKLTKDAMEYYKDLGSSSLSRFNESNRLVNRYADVYRRTIEKTCNEMLGIYGKIPVTKIVKHAKAYEDVLSETLSKTVSDKAYREVRGVLDSEYTEELDKIFEEFYR